MVIVPFSIWKGSEKRCTARGRLRAMIAEVRERNKDADPQEIEREVAEAVRAVRAEPSA